MVASRRREVSLEGPNSSFKESNPGWSNRTLATAFSTSSVINSTLNIHFFTMSSRPILFNAFSKVFPIEWTKKNFYYFQFNPNKKYRSIINNTIINSSNSFTNRAKFIHTIFDLTIKYAKDEFFIVDVDLDNDTWAHWNLTSLTGRSSK